ncbi:hypothetical protein [Pseudothauera rhizosphaerae]|uniref:Uncharacterized protein n=1 Tax=Pseudothauera rhizosphaerae TaxID=2565932 RepID=A0A4V3W9F8_9RHOO|nr:hypothetical protein [Pseudothauera rhizosphaerae]THF55134.1 hypothetical protein E6O51_21055 [Pseudothauera rhizosphaerae]
MKTRGIQNAINRLAGSRRLGSKSLIDQATKEAEHALQQARAWLDRRAERPDGEIDERKEELIAAIEALAEALSQHYAILARDWEAAQAKDA